MSLFSTLRLEPWRTRVLWASLALNVFGACLLATPLLWRHPHPPPRPMSLEFMVRRMAHHLPEADAETLRAAMREGRPQFEAARERLEQARLAVADTLRREPYDPRATAAALAVMQARLGELAGRFEESFVAAMTRLSPEGRAAMAGLMVTRR